jgi:hypothetical protein
MASWTSSAFPTLARIWVTGYAIFCDMERRA